MKKSNKEREDGAAAALFKSPPDKVLSDHPYIESTERHTPKSTILQYSLSV